MPEPNCKSCKHYFDGHNGAVQPRCKLVMDRIKQRIEEDNATTDEVRYYCGFGDFNPDWTCEKYEKKQESTKVSWTWDESKKALIDICEALCGFEESDLIELKPKEIARRILLKIYYSENLLSLAKGEPDTERDKTDEGFLEFVTDKGYDISKEQLEKLRREASVCAAIETVEVAPVRHGRWVLLPNRTAPSKLFKCSECGNVTEHEYFSRNGYYPFCKDCGAKMDGKEEKE